MDSVILKDIIKNYSTPLYVFDIYQMKQRIQYLRENLPSKIFLCYAIKANTFVVNDMDKYIDRFEVCSPGEYQICKEKNINSGKVLISGVYKTPEVIKEMIEKSKNYRIIEVQKECLIKYARLAGINGFFGFCKTLYYNERLKQAYTAVNSLPPKFRLPQICICHNTNLGKTVYMAWCFMIVLFTLLKRIPKRCIYSAC